MKMKLFFKDQTFSYELLRAVSYSGYQGAEPGECLSIAAKIKEGNFFSLPTIPSEKQLMPEA